MVSRLDRARTFGSMRFPARANRNMLVNDPAGFPSGFGPVNGGGFFPGGPFDTTSSDPAFFWIGSSDGGVVGPHGPFTGPQMLASVERATGLIVGNVCGLPWRVYRGSWRGDQSGETLQPPLWASDPMLVGSSPGVVGSARPLLDRRTGFGVWAGWMRDALWFGRGYVAFQPSAGGEPLPGTIRNLSPAAVEHDDDGWWLGSDDDSLRTPVADNGDIAGTGYRLLPLVEPFGDGTGVLGRHAATLGLAAEVRGYASGTFRSGVPAGYLKVTQPGMTAEQADALKSRWLEAHGGNRRTIAVLSATTEFNPVSVSPVDAQLVEVDHMALRMVAHAFNLSARALDSGASAGNTYANIQDERQDRVDDTLLPWKRVFEESISGVLPYGTWLELDMRGFLQTDPLKRTAYYKSMMDLGAMTSDEVRQLERMPPMPDELEEPAPPAPELDVVPEEEVAADVDA